MSSMLVIGLLFALVASPILRPARSLAGPRASERQVRWVAFALALGAWLITLLLDLNFGGPSVR